MAIWIFASTLLLFALYLFVWPILWAGIIDHLRGEEFVEGLADGVEGVFESFGSRFSLLLLATGVGGLLWLAWQMVGRN